MYLITWNESYSVKVKAIDDQHKRLIEIINKLFVLMQESQVQTGLKPVLTDLNAYADYHFRTEEKFFIQFDYEKTLEHVAAHHAYVKKVGEFMTESNVSDFRLSYEIIDFLENWWLEHMTGMDQEYVECFTSHGLH